MQFGNKDVSSVILANQPFTDVLCSLPLTTPLSTPRHPESLITPSPWPNELLSIVVHSSYRQKYSHDQYIDAKGIMSGYYGSRSRNTSRHQQDRSHERSHPFHFGGDFMGGLGDDFFGDSSRGRNQGYRTEEQRPQDFSYAPSSPRRGREENSYATENVYSGRFGSAARPSTGRRQRAGSEGS
jgi:hypothetical protein